MLCRDDGQAIDGFQPNPAFAEVCIVDGQITLRKEQGYSFKDNPASLRVVSTTNVRTYQRSDFDTSLEKTGVLVANDTSWFDEKGYLRNKLVDWPASAVDVIYLELLNEATDYGHRDDLEQRIYIFRRPTAAGSAVLCRDDGQAIDGFQPNPAFAEVCIVRWRNNLAQKARLFF